MKTSLSELLLEEIIAEIQHAKTYLHATRLHVDKENYHLAYSLRYIYQRIELLKKLEESGRGDCLGINNIAQMLIIDVNTLLSKYMQSLSRDV